MEHRLVKLSQHMTCRDNCSIFRLCTSLNGLKGISIIDYFAQSIYSHMIQTQHSQLDSHCVVRFCYIIRVQNLFLNQIYHTLVLLAIGFIITSHPSNFDCSPNFSASHSVDDNYSTLLNWTLIEIQDQVWLYYNSSSVPDEKIAQIPCEQKK